MLRKVIIVDYGMGNLFNVIRAFEAIECNVHVTAEINKIIKAEKSNGKGEKGKVISDNFEIACEKDTIKVLEIQRQGKRIQKINEFMLGTQIKKGTDLN